MTASCLYEGTIRHRRSWPRKQWSHRIALAYLDLDELPRLVGGRLVRRRPGFVRFRRRDYLGDPSTPLTEAVGESVLRLTGTRAQGPVRVLTHPRSYGLCFNPVSFYFCFDSDGETVEALLAEVTNTPWGERHTYALPGVGGRVLSGGFAKELHVSPFMGMDHDYTWRASAPGETLSVHVESHRDGQLAFEATLALRRRELTRASLAGVCVRYPFATLRTLALIYGHAIGLRLAGAPQYRHPRETRS